MAVGDRRWCKTCHRMREVEDEFVDSHFDTPRTEQDFQVRVFSCGHEQVSEGGPRRFLLW